MRPIPIQRICLPYRLESASPKVALYRLTTPINEIIRTSVNKGQSKWVSSLLSIMFAKPSAPSANGIPRVDGMQILSPGRERGDLFLFLDDSEVFSHDLPGNGSGCGSAVSSVFHENHN